MTLVNVELNLGRQRMQATIDVPEGRARLVSVLPIVELVADIVVEEGVKAATASGRTISCKAGCGACCRQLVPISATEARRLAALVDAMPEPRRSLVVARFNDALARLRQSGTLAKLEARADWSGDTDLMIGAEYFHQGIACPFLEDESCSIHPDRPIPCREFLVTTPAAHCSRPDVEDIDRVALPLHVWTALRELERDNGESGQWVPLVMSLDWVGSYPEPPVSRTGQHLIQQFITRLNEQSLNPPPAAP